MTASTTTVTALSGRDPEYDDAALDRLADLLVDRLAARLGGLIPEQPEQLVDAAQCPRRGQPLTGAARRYRPASPSDHGSHKPGKGRPRIARRRQTAT